MEPVKEVSVSFTRRYPLEEKTCPVCGTLFQGNKLATYCGKRCAKKAAWKRYSQNCKEKGEGQAHG